MPPLKYRRSGATKNSLFFLIFLLIATPSHAPVQTQPLRDSLGYGFSPEPPAERIISLAPNLTEILFSIGLGDKIVGVTRFCNYPPEAKEIDKVGGIIDPDLEKIASLKPDLILAFRGTPLPVLARIRSMGWRLFVLNEGETIEELFPLIRIVGQVTSREKQAEELSLSLERRYEAVVKKLSFVASRPRVLLLLSGPGYWTSGGRGFLNDLLKKAGGTPVTAASRERWVLLNPEEVLGLAPEAIVILASSAEAFDKVKVSLLKKASLKAVPALAQKRFFALDEDSSSRFGPRLIQALEELARWLHPRAFQ